MLSCIDGSEKYRYISLLLVCVQSATNYKNYEMQAKYFMSTDNAYKNFIEDHDAIAKVITDYVSIDKSQYCVDILFKRTPLEPSDGKKFEFDNQGVCKSSEYKITVVDREMQDFGLTHVDKRKPINQATYKNWVISIYANGV